jgi:hypothetical protein
MKDEGGKRGRTEVRAGRRSFFSAFILHPSSFLMNARGGEVSAEKRIQRDGK